MLTEVALVVVQLRTAVAPGVIVLGCALNVIVGPEVVTLTTVGGAVDPPPHPMAAIKTINKRTNADMRREHRIDTP
jgi:hypothetical protein